MIDQLNRCFCSPRICHHEDRANGHGYLHCLIVPICIEAVRIIKADAVAAEVAAVEGQI